MRRREFLRRTVAAVGGGAAIASDGSGGLERERMCVPRVRGRFTAEELAALSRPTVIMANPTSSCSVTLVPPCEAYYLGPHRECHCGGEGTG